MAIGKRRRKVCGAQRGTYPPVDVRVLPEWCWQGSKVPWKTVCDNLGYFAIRRRPDGIVCVGPALWMGCRKHVSLSMQGDGLGHAENQQARPERRRKKCGSCLQRLNQDPLSACAIARLGVTIEGGDFNTPRTGGHPDAKQMGDGAGSKLPYATEGDEPKRQTASYLYPVASRG